MRGDLRRLRDHLPKEKMFFLSVIARSTSPILSAMGPYQKSLFHEKSLFGSWFISSGVPIRFGYSANVKNILHDLKSQGFESSRSINIHFQSQFAFGAHPKSSYFIPKSSEYFMLEILTWIRNGFDVGD